MTNATYWGELLFKLVAIPFLLLVILLIASQVWSLRRYAASQSIVPLQPALWHPAQASAQASTQASAQASTHRIPMFTFDR